jgi:hypothetical protein
MTKCTFNEAWVGECGEEDCHKHSNLKCDCCGAPATRSCPETFGFVCGASLCDNCEHELTAEGVNYSGCRHVKKGEQKYTPWHARETT